MVKEKISFAYVSQILPGMEVSKPLLPQIWWRNVDPALKYMVALTMGVIIDKTQHVNVNVELLHEDSDVSCIDENQAGASQFDHFIGYPSGRDEFIGVSTLHVGGVSLKKIGMYTMTVKILEGDKLLDKVETCFFVADLKEQVNG